MPTPSLGMVPIGIYKPSGLPTLEDNLHEVEVPFKLEKNGTHAKIKWIGSDSSHSQWIKLFKLWKIDP